MHAYLAYEKNSKEILKTRVKENQTLHKLFTSLVYSELMQFVCICVRFSSYCIKRTSLAELQICLAWIQSIRLSNESLNKHHCKHQLIIVIWFGALALDVVALLVYLSRKHQCNIVTVYSHQHAPDMRTCLHSKTSFSFGWCCK